MSLHLHTPRAFLSAFGFAWLTGVTPAIAISVALWQESHPFAHAAGTLTALLLVGGPLVARAAVKEIYRPAPTHR